MNPQVARRVAELQLALAFLTRLPAGRIDRRLLVPLGATVWAWPVAGVAVGAAGAAVLGLGLAAGLGPMVAALLAMTAVVVVTGALHEDAVADVADGFGGGQTRAQRLAIMRDSRLGSYGAVALFVVLALRWASLAELAAADGGRAAAAMVVAAAASRAAMAVPLLLLPPARRDGLGHEAGAVAPAQLAAALGVTLLVGLLMLPPGAVAAVIVATLVASALMLVLAQAKIGGQTGDVCGAAQQLAELAAWIVMLGLR